MEKENVITLVGISKVYKLYNSKTERAKEALSVRGKKYHKEFHALRDINISIKQGEILGVIGKNGSGKSTLLKIISGILTPTAGSIESKGNIVPLLELGSGFNPEYTGIDNIHFYNSILGIPKKETNRILNDIIDFADIGDHLYQPLKTYSSGMKARLAFAVAISVDPDILILDEILSVGDEAFRRKSFAKMEALFNSGKTIIYVSHSLGSVVQLCNRVILLNEGKIIEEGEPKEVIKKYEHLLFQQEQNTQNHKQKQEKQSQSKHLNENKREQEITNCKDSFNPNLIPKSTLITKNSEISLDYIEMVNNLNMRVNTINTDNVYTLIYSIIIEEDLHDINFTIAIHDEKGLCIASSIYPSRNEVYDSLSSGQNVKIEWNFENKLLQGNYFVNFGIKHKQIDSWDYLYRAVDILWFKVKELEIKNNIAKVRLFNTPKIEIQKN